LPAGNFCFVITGEIRILSRYSRNQLGSIRQVGAAGNGDFSILVRRVHLEAHGRGVNGRGQANEQDEKGAD
jgi:hypothetical protein